MKNVTITMSEEVARWVRIEAARHGESVSRYVGGVMATRMAAESRYHRAMEGFLARGSAPLSAGTGYPRRDELYDR